MILLKPQQVKDSKNQELTRDVLRVQETERVVKETNQRLAKSQADFEEARTKNLKKWAEEEEEHSKRVLEMKKEIDSLEEKRLNALIPINILKDSVENDMKDAKEFLAKLREREDNAEKLTEKLEERLDEVGDREQLVRKQETALTLKTQGIDRQAETIKFSNLKLTEEIANFAKKKQEEESDIERRKTEILFRERSLESKIQSINRTEKALSDKEARLTDERATLDRAWKELKRRQISP